MYYLHKLIEILIYKSSPPPILGHLPSLLVVISHLTLNTDPTPFRVVPLFMFDDFEMLEVALRLSSKRAIES